MKFILNCSFSIFSFFFILSLVGADEYQDTQEIKGAAELGYLGRGLFLGLEGEYKDPGTIGGEVSFYYLIPERNHYGHLAGRLAYDFTGFALGLGGGGYFSESSGGVGPSLSLRIGPKDFFYFAANYDSADTFTQNPFVRLDLGAGAQLLSGSHLRIGYLQEGWAENPQQGNGSLYSVRLEQDLYEIFRFDELNNLIALIELGFRVGGGSGIILNFGAGYKTTALTGDSLAQRMLARGDGLEDSGDLDEAIRVYREVVDLFPDSRFSDEARFRLGQIARKRGRREEAEGNLQSLQELAEKFPESVYDARLRYQEGIDRIEERRWIEAYAAFDSLINKYPSEPLAKEAEYWIEYILGIITDYDRIRLELRAFLGNYPQVELSDDAQYRLARSFFDQGDYHRSIAAYNNLASQFPESELRWLADYDKGLAYQNLGDWEKALGSYFSSLSLARSGRPLSDFELTSTAPSVRVITDNSFVYDRLNYRIGNSNWNLGNFGESLDELLKVDAARFTQSDSDDLELKLAYAYFNLEEYANALQRLASAISRAGEVSLLPPLVAYMVGRSHEALGSLDEAITAYHLFLDRNPGDLMFDQARMRLGYTHLKVVDYWEALDLLIASFKVVGDESVRMDLSYRIGYIYHELEGWDGVITFYEDFLRDYGDKEYDLETDAGSPYYPEAGVVPIVYKNEVLLRLGDAYFSTDRYASALKEYIDLLGRTEDRGVVDWVRHRVGVSYDQLQRWVEAVDAYETFLAEHADSEFVDNARLRLGLVYFHVGSYEGALDEFLYSLTRSWDEETITLLEYKVGQTLEHLDRWEEALASHQEFIVKHPEDSLVGNALAGIGNAYRILGRTDEALGVYREATSRYPASSTSDDAQLNIGRIHLNRGDYDDALVELQKVLKNYPQRDSIPEAELLVGKTFRGLGDESRALGLLNQIIDKYSQNAGIIEEAQKEIANIQGGAS